MGALAALALLAPLAFAADDGAIRRKLVDLFLGDSLETVRQIYPPAQDWPDSVDPRTQARRYRLERTYAKKFPTNVDALWLSFKSKRLVEVQLIYDADYTRERPVDAFVSELSLSYGEPTKTDGRYWWSDGKSVLRVFYAEVPVLKEGARAVELRTCLQLMDAKLFLPRVR